MAKYIFLGLFIFLVISMIVIVVSLRGADSDTDPAEAAIQNAVKNITVNDTTPVSSRKPRQTTTLTDCGYLKEPRGYYDFSENDYADYCRWVGDTQGTSWFACAIAGSTDQYARGYDPMAPKVDLKAGDKCFNKFGIVV